MLDKVGTIKPPEKPSNIPTHSKWLLGQGAGTWFCIDTENEKYRIRRYTPNGKLDCDRFFELEKNGSILDMNQTYEFTHISHCAKCRIIQNKITFIFNYINN